MCHALIAVLHPRVHRPHDTSGDKAVARFEEMAGQDNPRGPDGGTGSPNCLHTTTWFLSLWNRFPLIPVI